MKLKKQGKKKNIGHECFQEKAKRGTPKVQMFPQQKKKKKKKKKKCLKKIFFTLNFCKLIELGQK